MVRYTGSIDLSSQKTMFEQVVWESSEEYNLSAPSNGHNQRGAPSGNKAASNLEAEQSRPPYWEYNWTVDSANGLALSNIVVRDTQSSGSTERVFQSLTFSDLEITFTDGTRVDFDIGAALGDLRSSLVTAADGSRITVSPHDTLFQRGINLRLFTNVLAAQGGFCNVLLEMSAVFRGAAADFDPGGVPVAMLMWPQLAWSWDNFGATKTVKEFRGSVVPVLENTMFGMTHGNVASFFTDSNTSMNGIWRGDFYGVRAFGGSLGGLPFGWGMTFDYVTPNVSIEREITGVYGPNDGNKFTGSTSRRRRYSRHVGAVFGALDQNPIIVDKAKRQGDFDNIHTHAKMMNTDPCGNEQVHAPFCGHSCVHQHWRWSKVAGDGAVNGRGWQYKGWSMSGTGSATPFSTDNAPLIPPNQKLTFGVLAPGSVRHSRDHIVAPGSSTPLNTNDKKYWHTVDIFDPAANQMQVIFEHGIGWAYRYSTPWECTAVNGLTGPFPSLTVLPFSSPTQAEMAQFFKDRVYPTFRYMISVPFLSPICTDPQVPTGSYSAVHSGGSNIAMEDL